MTQRDQTRAERSWSISALMRSLSFIYFIFLILFFFLIYFWLLWAFVAVHGLSTVAVSTGYFLLQCVGCSLQ